MKKLIYTLGIIAAAAFTFSSCQKEQSIEQPSGKLVTVTFTAEKAGLDTKTAAVEGEKEVSFIWTEEDLSNIKLFTVGEDDALTVVTNPTITKVSDTKLTISAQVAPNATYTFKAMLSGKWTNDGKKARLNDSQSPSATNFDPKADVLISDNMEVTVGEAEGEEETVATSDLEMVFRRPVVVNKMTLKNLKAGEAIDKVVITSGKEIAGYFYTDGTPIGDKKIITLNYNKEVTVPEGGQFPVYFITTPGTGHSLTVEVTTDQFVYTKSFAEGKSIDFNLGQFTKFNLALPAGVANTALSLPIEDSMEWAAKGSDGTAVINVADIPVTKDEKKVYSDASYIYYGIDGLKMGSSGNRGVLTTSELNLSSAYYIAVSARAWLNSTNTADESQVEFLVDGESVYKSENLSADYQTYYFNAPAATASSKIAIKVAGKRGYIKDVEIKAGSFVAPPVINVTSANPMSVSNTNDLYAVEYTIGNPTEGVSISASANVSWIHDFDYTTAGEIGFEVDAQEAGAPSRSGEITLAYSGAKSVKVTVEQAAGAGATTYYYVPMTEAPSDWTAETYIIVANTSVLNATSTSSWGGVTSVTKESDGSIKSNEDLEACEIAVSGDATDGYYLCFANGTAYYIVLQTSNGFALNTTKPSLTIDLSVSSIRGFSSSTSARNLRLNGTSGFRWYGNTTGTAAVLYKKVAK